MQISEIESNISGKWGTQSFKSYGLKLSETNGSVALLLTLTRHQDSKVAWRAAYLMDMVNDHAPEKLLPFLDEITSRLNTEQNQSLLRHFTRILSKHDILTYANGLFVDACFKHLINKKSAIAVKANFLKLIQKLLIHYPELRHELNEIFELIRQDETPAIRFRLRQIIDEN